MGRSQKHDNYMKKGETARKASRPFFELQEGRKTLDGDYGEFSYHCSDMYYHRNDNIENFPST